MRQHSDAYSPSLGGTYWSRLEAVVFLFWQSFAAQ